MLGLHHQLARGVEERGRAVVALLDVGRVGGADQRRAHLVAGGAQAADQDLERDRVEPLIARFLCTHLVGLEPRDDRAGVVDLGPPARRQDQGRLGQLEDDRALGPGAGRRARRAGPAVSIHSPSKRTGRELSSSRPRRRPRGPRLAAPARPSPGGCRRGRPRPRGRGGRSAPRGRARSARAGRPGRGRPGPGPAARRPGRRSASRRRPRARRSSSSAPVAAISSSTSAAIRSALSSAPLSITVRAVSRRRSEAQRPRAERTPLARGQRIVSIPSSAAIAAACIGPAPPKGSRAKPRGSTPRSTVTTRSARTISWLATRTIPAAVSSGSRPSERGERADRRLGRLGVEVDAAGEARVGGEVAEQEVGVGHRRLAAAAPVAGGPGLGAGRARPDPQRAAACRASRSSRRRRRPCGRRPSAAGSCGRRSGASRCGAPRRPRPRRRRRRSRPCRSRARCRRR